MEWSFVPFEIISAGLFISDVDLSFEQAPKWVKVDIKFDAGLHLFGGDMRLDRMLKCAQHMQPFAGEAAIRQKFSEKWPRDHRRKKGLTTIIDRIPRN